MNLIRFFLALGGMVPLLIFPQTSDLERSGHKTTYNGDSIRLKPLIEKVRSDYENVIAERKEICEESIFDIGELIANGKKLQVVHQQSGIGISCRGIANILLFEEDEFIGFYRTDYVLILKIRGTQLLIKHENVESTPLIVDFSEGIPEHISFGVGYSGDFKDAEKYKRDD